MSYEEGITRQAFRRKEEQAVRAKELLNRSIEDHRRQKEETRVAREKHEHFYINCVRLRTDIKPTLITLTLIPLTWN